MKLKQLIKCIVFFQILICSFSYASEKYCTPNGKHYDIHIFGFTFESESQKKHALKGLTDLRNKFQANDKVRIFAYTNKDYSIILDSCVPGCVEKKFSEQLFSSECSVMVAKRDMQDFQNQFNTKILSLFNKPKTNYDIFESLQSLIDSYRSSVKKESIYAVISLIPNGIDPKNITQLNKLYVQKRETIKFPSSFPKIKLIGNSNDQELISFWADVFRGHDNFEFEKY